MRDFLQLTADELRALPKDRTVFFYALGAAEDHGPHLPIGFPLAVAEEEIARIGRALSEDRGGWECVRMPPAPLGIDTHTSDVAFAVRAHVLRDWLLDTGASLVRLGFRNFIAVSGQLGPRQLTAIEEVGPMLRRRFPFKRGKSAPRFLSLSSFWVNPKSRARSLLFPNPLEHGGSEDVSLALALSSPPLLADLSSLPAKKLERPLPLRFLDWLTHRVKGYWGSPAEGTREKGEWILGERSREGALAALRLLQGGSDRSRSGYAAYPHYRSFFKAWLWAVSVGIVLFFWLYLTLQYLPG